MTTNPIQLRILMWVRDCVVNRLRRRSEHLWGRIRVWNQVRDQTRMKVAVPARDRIQEEINR